MDYHHHHRHHHHYELEVEVEVDYSLMLASHQKPMVIPMVMVEQLVAVEGQEEAQ
jgi:hypothetical protein